MKTAVITGASRGIGRALAEKFLTEGYYVIGTSTTGTSMIDDENFVCFQLDLSNTESITNCTEQIVAVGKSVDILIHNVGVSLEEELGSEVIVPKYVRYLLEVNVLGTIGFGEAVIPLMNEGGHIINISSRAGSLGFTGYKLNYPGYRISKTALNMVTRIWADRLAPNITVSSIHPGWVRTDMGGNDGELSPEEAANDIFALAHSKIETGQFWYKGEKFPW